MSKTKFENASKTRTYIRQRITRICNQIDAGFDELEDDTKKLYIGRLESLDAEIKVINKSLIDYLVSVESDDSVVNDEYESIEYYEDRIILTLNKLKTRPMAQSNNSNTSLPNIQSQKLKLPEVPLPTFSNSEKESLEKFFHNFENIIDKHNLTSFEKFIYLRNQLKGSPSSLIESLDVSNRNY